MKNKDIFSRVAGGVLIILSLTVIFVENKYFWDGFVFDYEKANFINVTLVIQRWAYFLGILLYHVLGWFLISSNVSRAFVIAVVVYAIALGILELPVYNYHLGHGHSFWTTNHFH